MSAKTKNHDLVDTTSKDVVRSKGQKSSTDEMDARLEMCFLYAIKFSVKESDLPLLSSTFYKSHMTKYCPAGEHIEIKKSSYKTLSKFLKQKEKLGLINVKTRSKGGGEVISRIDKSHAMLPEMPEYGDSEKTEPVTDSGASAATSNRPVFMEMFEITPDVFPIFRRCGYKEGDAVNAREARKIINKYVDDRDLSDVDFDYFLSKLNYQCEIMTKTDCVIIKNDDFCPIKIDLLVMKIAPYRQTTAVENLDEFGIDMNEFCDTVHKKLRCGASVLPEHTDPKHGDIGVKVVVQGNQIEKIGDILITDYGIPRKFIVIVIPDEYEIVPKLISKEELLTDKKDQKKLNHILCITGIAEQIDEDLKEVVIRLGKDLKVDICKTDINACERRGKPRPGRKREIVVEFASMSVFQDLFMKRGRLRKMEHRDGVYINEDLTPHRREVFYHARQYARAKLIKWAFSEDGNVFVIDNSGKKHMIIASEELTVFGELIPPRPKLKQFNFRI